MTDESAYYEEENNMNGLQGISSSGGYRGPPLIALKSNRDHIHFSKLLVETMVAPPPKQNLWTATVFYSPQSH